ncbi:GDP-L-fucose synthase family protein [Balneola sp. MJW-20]|uniref:GDP-L-fucose synthase family protein n=1 Tax=Gracilimonas aurantiaca TaxID=3234185 RepID=UPI003465F0E9
MKIFIAGHRGMVGSAIFRSLSKSQDHQIITATSTELDLRDQSAVNDFINKIKPEVIIDAAAKVGGIMANNTYPWQFLYDNVAIQTNLINAAHKNDVEKFIFLGSSCIYPKLAEQPLREDSLLTGPLEPTNEWYAIAKITGVKMCEALRKQYGRSYTSLMPTNLYGPGDNFDLETSHVLPAMIRKFHDAMVSGHSPVTLWGSGTPKREFLHVDDVASAVLHVLNGSMDHSLYNLGTGKDLSIKELAEMVQGITGHKGEIVWDSSKPDGTPRKLMDVSRLGNEGWTYSIELEEGISDTYDWFLENVENFKEVKITD